MVQRVLCLPGYGQNANILKIKMAPIQKRCEGQVEFVYVDPCFKLYAPDGGDIRADDAEPVDDLRAWGYPQDEFHTVFAGLEDMALYMRDWLAKQPLPFDGIFGFSQGAGVASIITCLLEDPSRYPPFLIDGKAPHPPLKFSILCSGAAPLESVFMQHYQSPPIFKTPTLHVLGRLDIIVGWKRSEILINSYQDPKIEYHDGCHFVPTKPSWQKLFQEFIVAFEDQPSEKKDETLAATGLTMSTKRRR